MADVERLWRLAQSLALPPSRNAAWVFEPVGLILHEPSALQAWEYETTPANGLTFASTGGDGVHFSVLGVEGDGAGVVVMTVPMAFDNPNHVVGASVSEFLALGCRTGYFTLEALAYEHGRAELLAELDAAQPPADAHDAALLRHIVNEFDARPWPHVSRRLHELDETYRSSIQLRPR
jgi:hypothetical protein